jgi:hypothetical protein
MIMSMYVIITYDVEGEKKRATHDRDDMREKKRLPPLTPPAIIISFLAEHNTFY